MSKVTLLRDLFLIVFRAVYLVLWFERKHAVVSFQIKMFLVGKVPRSHPFSLTVAPIDGQNSNRGLVPAARCSSYAFVIYNGRKESDGDSENHHVHSDDVDIDYDGDIDDEDSLDDDDSDGDDDNEGDTLEGVFMADDSAIRSSSPIDSTSLVGSTAREAVEAIVQQVLAQRTLAAERIKWVQDRLEVTATCLRPEPGPDEPLDLSTPPSRPSIEDLNAAHRAIYALLETQGPLENFLESCEARPLSLSYLALPCHTYPPLTNVSVCACVCVALADSGVVSRSGGRAGVRPRLRLFQGHVAPPTTSLSVCMHVCIQSYALPWPA
jgi:hypothetical protein